MSEKNKPDLVAGRLSGQGKTAGPSPLESMRKAGNYGSNRLGLMADDDQDAVPQAATPPPPDADQVVVLGPPAPPQDAKPTLMRAPALRALLAAKVPHADEQTADKPLAKPVAVIPNFDFSEPAATTAARPNPWSVVRVPSGDDVAAGVQNAKGPLAKLLVAGCAVVVVVTLWYALRPDDAVKDAAAQPTGANYSDPRVTIEPVAGRPEPLAQRPVEIVLPEEPQEPIDEPLDTVEDWPTAPAPVAPAVVSDPSPKAPTSTVLVPPATTPAAPAPAVQPTTGPKPKTYRPCPPGLRLTGVIRQAGGGFANINGKFYSPGERVAGATLVEIRDLSVEMKIGDEYFLLPVANDPATADAGSSDEDQADQPQDASAPEESGGTGKANDGPSQ